MSKLTKRRVQKTHSQHPFDKYELYSKAVQSAEVDVVFFKKVFKELKKKDPMTFREDFCGTFMLSCEWVKLNSKHQSYGVDLDPEPLEYGKRNYLSKLTESQKKRIHIQENDVLRPGLPVTDIAAALNFSYFLFKSRMMMKQYFLNALKSIKPEGLFILDVFGGSACFGENEEVTKHKKFNYYWHQESFDPVSNKAKFHIHFKLKGHKKTENVFTYDWRMWTIPELRDLLEEVGFKKTHIYWEGTNRAGGGNGVFTRTEHGEECEAWIAYIVAEK